MNVSCPHCSKQLKLSEKFKASLLQLEPGKKVSVKCTQCSNPFPLDGSILQQQATPTPKPRKRRAVGAVKPPSPPDTSWLKEGVFDDSEVVEDIPLALVLIPEGDAQGEVVRAVEALGYRAELASTAEIAIEKMEFVNYSSVILHAEFEPGGLADGQFHNFMRLMAMSKRRYIFYVLIGKEMRTLYDLQALANSANIVVNEQDVPYFGTILRKTIPEYESLFGPLMEELRVFGK